MYRARNTKLDRGVALNHSTIAHIYGFETATLDDRELARMGWKAFPGGRRLGTV